MNRLLDEVLVPQGHFRGPILHDSFLVHISSFWSLRTRSIGVLIFTEYTSIWQSHKKGGSFFFFFLIIISVILIGLSVLSY